VRGIPYKCDICKKVDLTNDGTTNNVMYTKSIYTITPPQIKLNSEPTEHTDICSKECLLKYAEQQLTLG
jgi:hypothetical protein